MTEDILGNITPYTENDFEYQEWLAITYMEWDIKGTKLKTHVDYMNWIDIGVTFGWLKEVD